MLKSPCKSYSSDERHDVNSKEVAFCRNAYEHLCKYNFPIKY